MIDISGQEKVNNARPLISVIRVNEQVIVTSKNIFDLFDALCPLSLIKIEEWEGRIKKLVRGKRTITVNQFKFVFREYRDFKELEGSNLQSAVFRSSVFMRQDPTQEGRSNETELDIQALLVMGLLYCKADSEVSKHELLYRLACGDNIQPVISAE